MSIALPPPIPPQQSAPLELREQSLAQATVNIDYQGVQLHIFGSQLVPEERLRKVVLAAGNLSDAVRSVGMVYYLSGYPATLVSYASVGSGKYDVYVRVVPGRVSGLSGPAALLPYFSNLEHQQGPLRSSALERDRAVADAVAERRGEEYKPSFKPVGGDAVVLDLGEPAPGARQFKLVGSFSNYGNRYAGPYLADLGYRQDFSSADELTLSGFSSVRLLGLGGAASEPYHEGDGGWSKVTPFGVFGLQGRYADFRLDVEGERFSGEFSTVSASWLLPLYSDFQHRLNLQGKLERDHETVDAPLLPGGCNALGDLLNDLGLVGCPANGGGEVLSELYNSVELDLSYVARAQYGGRQAELQANLSMRKGLGPHHVAGSAASMDYFLWQPSVSARYGLTPQWSILGDASFQFGNSILPQQQQFVLGGPTSLHAYEAGAGVGDAGKNLRLGVEWKGDGGSCTERYELRPRAFIEYGSSRLEHDSFGALTGTVSAADAGAAAEMRFTSWLNGSLSLAQSFFHHGAENSPNGLATKYAFFQISAKY
jgi:hypothetical protein